MATGDPVVIQCQAEITAASTPADIQSAAAHDVGYNITVGAVDIFATNNGNSTQKYQVWVRPAGATAANKHLFRGTIPPLESVKVALRVPVGASDKVTGQLGATGSVTFQVLGDGDSA